MHPTVLAASNQEMYALLTGPLSPEDAERVQKMLIYAEQRKAAVGKRENGFFIHTWHTLEHLVVCLLQVCSKVTRV